MKLTPEQRKFLNRRLQARAGGWKQLNRLSRLAKDKGKREGKNAK